VTVLTRQARVNRGTRAQAQAPKLRLKVLSVGTDAKTIKGAKYKVATAILYLAPASEAGRGNLCPHASAGCRAACLFTAGRGKFDNVRTARINKTLRWFDDRRQFLADIVQDIAKLEIYCRKHKLTPAVRLNGTSDIPWENVILPDDGGSIMALFPSVKFYDYTKNPHRAIKAAKSKHPLVSPLDRGRFPENYSLTFSRAEDNLRQVRQVINAGGNVAAVYSADRFDRFTWSESGIARGIAHPIPERYFPDGPRIFNGDDSDARFLDPSGVVVALKAKGDARGDSSGFVIN
jgi:hypothetical protein